MSPVYISRRQGGTVTCRTCLCSTPQALLTYLKRHNCRRQIGDSGPDRFPANIPRGSHRWESRGTWRKSSRGKDPYEIWGSGVLASDVTSQDGLQPSKKPTETRQVTIRQLRLGVGSRFGKSPAAWHRYVAGFGRIRGAELTSRTDLIPSTTLGSPD